MGRADFVYGFHPARELLRHTPQRVLEVLVAARTGKRRAEIEELCRKHGVPLKRLGQQQLEELAGGATHNGFVVRRSPSGAAVVAPQRDLDLVVLVEDIQDPRNLGALIRVCEGVGAAKLLIRDRGSAPLTAAAIKTSAGAVEWLPVERVVNSAQVMEAHKKNGFWVYGAAADGKPPWDVDLTGPLMICLGGEESGLRQRTLALCDGVLGLPMLGRVESLNLATAAAAILYEAVRQRQTAAASPRTAS